MSGSPKLFEVYAPRIVYIGKLQLPHFLCGGINCCRKGDTKLLVAPRVDATMHATSAGILEQSIGDRNQVGIGMP
jgi:hypothetical protein